MRRWILTSVAIAGFGSTFAAAAVPASPNHQEAKRQDSTNSSSASASASLSETSNMSSTSATGPVVTEMAYFTAGDAVFSVSSNSAGFNVVAGKTLSVGGPEYIVGGAEVTAAPSGIEVNGVPAAFQTVTVGGESSESMEMPTTSSTEASESASEASSEPSSEPSESADAAVPRATAGVAAVALVGAVIGALVL